MPYLVVMHCCVCDPCPICDWLSRNGVNPNGVPHDAEISIDWLHLRLRYEWYTGNGETRTVGPDGQALREKRTARLRALPPPRWKRLLSSVQNWEIV